MTIIGVSGTVSNGNSITITGSSFGSKPTAAPHKFDDFSGGVDGELVTGWESGTGSGISEYSDAVTRGSNSLSCYHDYVNNTNVSLCENETEFTTVYLDFWIYIDVVAAYSRNYKVWRLWRNGEQLQVFEQIYCSTHRTDAVIEVFETGDDNISNFSHNQQNSPNNVWKHYQVELIQSTPNTADGRIVQWVNGADDLEYQPNTITRTTGTYDWNELRIGHNWERDADGLCLSSSSAHIYFDSVYIDTSLARVEIIDNPTYSLSVHREIQIPTNWEATGDEISVTVTQGSFADEATAWVAVIDSSGDVQGTYEITFGGAAPGDATTSFGSGSTSFGSGTTSFE